MTKLCHQMLLRQGNMWEDSMEAELGSRPWFPGGDLWQLNTLNYNYYICILLIYTNYLIYISYIILRISGNRHACHQRRWAQCERWQSHIVRGCYALVLSLCHVLIFFVHLSCLSYHVYYQPTFPLLPDLFWA
jgi:hypothetical protein